VWRHEERRQALSDEAYARLAPHERHGLVRQELTDASYYAKYSSPLAYARALDLAARFGLDGLAGKKIVDFGYGDIGQLQLFSLAGAHAVGVDASALLSALYTSADDTTFPPGSIALADGRWPADASIVSRVGADIDVFISKNTLKKGYVRPEPPQGQTLNPRYLVDLGVAPDRFLSALHDATRPAALVVIYNICPAPARGPEFLPWSDGRSPFTRAEWEAARFDILSFDTVDDTAARAMGRAMRWDEGPDAMTLDTDLFAWFTVARRRP
jgi:hypothetical protein